MNIVNGRTYWVAINKVSGQAEGGVKSVTPHLYLGRKAAMAAKRSNYIRKPDSSPRGWSYRKETDDELLDRYDFVEVNLIEVMRAL